MNDLWLSAKISEGLQLLKPKKIVQFKSELLAGMLKVY